MKKTFILMWFLISFCLSVCGVYAQEDSDPIEQESPERVLIDGSALMAGKPFRFTVTVNSDEFLSFADAQSWITAILCPAENGSGDCQMLSSNVSGEDDTVMRVVLTAEALPLSGDYTLDISFTDVTGAFAQQSASFLITGIREAEEQPVETESAALLIGPASDAAETAGDQTDPTETPAAGDGAEQAETAVLEGTETALPEVAETETAVSAETEEFLTATLTPEAPAYEPELPTVTIGVSLTPSMRDMDGNNLIYGSTIYVGDTYLLQIESDSAMNDSVSVDVALPASILNGPLDPASGCLNYLRTDGSGLSIPGSRWNAENGNTFRCELSFTDSTWLASNPFEFTITQTGLPANETYEMSPLSWTYYPVNIAKYAASHQVQISDSRGNLICSDMVPCGYFNAEDVYVMTYKFPADWGAALPSGKDLSASVVWPADWAQSLSLGTDFDLASVYGSPCAVDADGRSTLVLEETAPGRYSASCTFVPSGISNPRQEPAVVRMDDNAWQVSNLNVYMPGTILKTEAVLSPSLIFQMTEDAPGEEQIRGGTIDRIYRTTRNYPNNGEGFGAPALYTLEARIEGISASRTPQPGDVVKVSWNVLDSLAAAGDLPACLTPSGNGYILGDLQQTGDGSWLASCAFRFPQTMPEKIPAGRLDMQLLSGVYQTSAFANVNGDPFQREKLVLDLDIPEHMLLNQPTVIHARLSDSTGGFSDYTRAVLSDMGVSLRNDWVYNYLTDCQGEFVLAADGTASCTAYFDQPTAGESDMHFELTSPAADYLFDVVMQPAEYFHIESVSEISASLSVKLFHAGTEMNLPAAPDDVFIVGDDYQLQFYLTPDPEFRDVLNSVALDGEGMVMDWWDPLVIRWAILPSGETGLNFYRDGDHFIARYDFSFSQGDLALDGNLNHMMMVPSISGWNIRTENDMDLVQLPFRVEKKPLSLSISDFYLPFSSDPVTELKVGEEATFFVSFDGIIDSLDMNQMLIGFDANGIRTPLTCEPDYAGSMLRCSIIGQCTDYAIDTYNAVCSTNVSLYASYNGDSVNRAAEAEPKFFSVRRGEITFTPAAEGSLSAADLYHIQEASEDLLYLRDATVNVSGWNLDSFLPRKVTDSYGTEYRSYPVIFNYEISGSAAIDDSLLRLDVKYQSGPASLVQENTISLSPRIVTDDMVMFELDFGSFEYLDDGRTVQQALEEAVAIESLTVRYPGSALVGSASASYQSEDLTFVIKVADLVELASDSGMPGMISFGGAFGTLIPRDSFTVYCTQLAQQLECSSELPPLFYDENGEMIQTDFADAGCWGKIQLSSGTDQIFTSNAWNPVCYLVGWDPAQKIVVAGAIQ